MSEKTIFISYSHDSAEHAERVRGLGASLSRDGCDCRIDVYKDTDEDWPTWMTRQLIEADFVLCVVTETYERRFRDQELPDVGLGVGWEAGLIRRLLYAKKLHNDRIFPVVFAKSDRDHIPLELQGYDSFLLDGLAGYEALLRKVIKRPFHTAPAIGMPPDLGTSATAPLFARPGEAPSPVDAGLQADISRIIKYAPAELIGREAETSLLNDSWAKVQAHEAKRPHILTFVALGGEGKTSLVAKWAADLAHQDWQDCDAVFAWSFYSQGTSETASSDLFLKEALIFFGDEGMANSSQSAFDKGRRLAQLVGERRTLLILDGLEPLQYAPSSPMAGELKDQGIATLLRKLAATGRGLCVLTTRYCIPDLKAFWENTAPQIELKRLSTEAGVHLLQNLGVRKGSGSQADFEKLVEEVKGHALTLNLLGTYLHEAHGGDFRKRDLVRLEEASDEQGGHAFRVMDSYVQWFRDEGDKGHRAIAVLRLLSLFDRPASASCIAALLKPPVILGMTKGLVGLNEVQWNITVSRLESAKLLSVNRDAAGVLLSLDTHALLREYFARERRTQHLEAWRSAHLRLYEHLCASTHEGDQPTLEDLEPLYQAVAHGCQAGLQQEACDDVYFRRTHRGNEYYSLRKLGAFGSDLGAVACFFDFPWGHVSTNLTDADQAWLLGAAATRLSALGRLAEAREPLRTALERRVKQQKWENAAAVASNLGDLELTLGEVAGAVWDAEQSVTYADRSGDAFERMARRTTHADALHQAGSRAEAEARFREAEQMQAERQPAYPLLYSLAGFRYCDLLLAEAERASWGKDEGGRMKDELLATCRAVSQRAAQTLKWVTDAKLGLLTIALDHLTLGRAALYEGLLKGRDALPRVRDSLSDDDGTKVIASSAGTSSSSDATQRVPTDLFETARLELDAAVSGLRRAGTLHNLPFSLLTRAWLRFLTGALVGAESAQEDLDEAWEIAERGPMKLFMADIHLYRARLFGRMRVEGGGMKYPWESPQADLAAAEKLINECGYGRRRGELEDAKRAILGE